MINAWSLMYEELNGTMDTTYPIKEDVMTDDKIEINTGIGNTAIYNVPDPDGGINTEKGYIPYDDIDDQPITITGGDTINFDDAPLPFSTFADNDDSIAHYVDSGIGNTAYVDTLNLDFSGIEGINVTSAYSDDTISFDTPTPGIQKDCTRKYKEDEAIKALQDYISTTYGGHYTSKENNVQTLDLIESVGDAESFCRSNAIKYLSRYDKKGQAKRDILKALHYSLLLYHFSGQLNETPTRGYETF